MLSRAMQVFLIVVAVMCAYPLLTILICKFMGFNRLGDDDSDYPDGC